MYHLTNSFVTDSFVTDYLMDCLASARRQIRGRFVFLGDTTRVGRAASADV